MRLTRRTERILFLCALLLIACACFLLSADGFFAEQFGDFRTWHMLAELAVLIVFLEAAGLLARDRRTRAGLLLFISAAFLWIHRSFAAVIVSGAYLCLLGILGETLLVPARRGAAGLRIPGYLRAAEDLLTGCAAEMILTAFLSGVHMGGAGMLKKALALLLVTGLLVFLLFRSLGLVPFWPEELPPDRAHAPGAARLSADSGAREERTDRAVRLLILALLLLEAGRMNITLDYDSVHYGLRSLYVLDNGGGVFENLGSVNQVYFYPKGLEFLTLPLCGTPTYGFVIGVSFWAGVLTVLLVRGMADGAAGPRAGRNAALAAACIPGIMNMSVSAKTDMVTLFFQLAFAAEIMHIIRSDSKDTVSNSLAAGAGFLLLTLTLKPTALVFSGVLFIAALLYLAVYERRFAAAVPGMARFLPLPVLPAAAFAGVTLRTLHLTGYPFVSVFTGIWERLGMHGHYPMKAQSIPNALSGLHAGALFRHALERLSWIFLAPAGDEALHVLIAWGSPLFPVLLLACAAGLSGTCGRKRAEAEGKKAEPGPAGGGKDEARHLRYLYLTLGLLLLFDGVSLVLLYQVDGNYYMLTYALAALTAAAAWERKGGASLLRAASPALLFGIFMTCLTNWAGARGFTEPRLLHYGFYDHVSDNRDYMILSAKEPIYRYLANAPRIRLLAMGEEPECYLYPCRAESYTDLEGSGGNVGIVKTLNEFKDYLEYAGIGYLYTEDGFLESHARAAEIIRYMNEDGSITTVITQEGNTLYEYHAGIRD